MVNLRICFGAFVLAGCTGDGSDIGPDISSLPDSSYRVLLRHADETDTNPLGVASATVSVPARGVVATSRRDGRADLAVRPSGRTVVSVDPPFASAVVGDRLVGYSVAVDAPGFDELPFVCYVPDVSASAGLTLNPGVQAGAVLDDSASSGAIVTIAAASVVGTGTAPSSTLRTGALAVGRLPGRLPDPLAGAWLTTRAVWVGATALEVAPGASLRLPNDLGAPAATNVELFHLDATTGEWTKVADGVVDGAGTNIDSIAGVNSSGLYCFAMPVATTTELVGRVVDLEGDSLEGVLVKVPQGFATTDGGGRFALPAIAAVDGAGAPRMIDVVCHGGPRLRGSRTSRSVALTPGVQTVPDIALDSERVLQLRGLLLYRGRVDPRQRVALGASEVPTARIGFSDDDGRFDLDGVPSQDWFSFLATRIDTIDTRFVLSTEGARLLNIANRNVDSRWFMLRVPWINGINVGALTYVVDSVGGGRIEDASIVRELGNGEDEFVRSTIDARLDRVNYEEDGRATAAFENFVDGKRVISAFSARRARSDRVELPLERAHHRPIGRFEPFGVVTGSVAELATTRVLRTTRRLGRPDWLDEVFRDRALLDTLPSTIAAPSGGLIAFTARVPSAGGNLALVAGTDAGPVFTLEHAWIEARMKPAAGTSSAVDLGTGGAADTMFTIAGGADALDAGLAASDFTVDWAVEFDDGRFIDVARDVGGNHTFAGSDVTVRLPARSGDFDGARHLVALTGSAGSGGATLTQRLFAAFEGSQSAVTMHPVPTISQPAPGAAVSSQGFTVDFTVPLGTTFLVLKLRQETTDASGDVIRDWTALLPPDDVSFEFRRLPGTAPTPLDVGAYTLTLTAARVETGPLTREEFQFERINARWVGLSWADLEVNAVSSVSIPLTLN